MKTLSNLIVTVAASVLAAAIAVVLAVADMKRFEEPAFSPLYRSTLKQAYSRFRETDKQVPLKPLPEAAVDVPNVLSPKVASGQVRKQVAHQSGQPAGRQVRSSSADLARGNQLFSQRKYAEALAAFQRYVGNNPNSAVGYHRIADTCVALGKTNEAMAAYRQALALQPRYWCVYGHMGDIEARGGKKDEAEKLFQKLISGYRKEAQEPGDKGIAACYGLAKFYVDHNRNLNEAIAHAEKAVAARPNEIGYLIVLETAYRKAERTKDALSVIEKIVKLKPEWAQYYKAVQDQLKAKSPAKREPEKLKQPGTPREPASGTRSAEKGPSAPKAGKKTP